MEIRRTFNIKEAEAALKHPAMYQDILSKLGVASFVLRDRRANIHLLVKEENILLGLINLTLEPNQTYYVHGLIYPEYRKEYAYLAFLKAEQWFWENTEHTEVYIRIPFQFPKVISFAERYGARKLKQVKVKTTHGTYSCWVLILNKQVEP